MKVKSIISFCLVLYIISAHICSGDSFSSTKIVGRSTPGSANGVMPLRVLGRGPWPKYTGGKYYHIMLLIMHNRKHLHTFSKIWSSCKINKLVFIFSNLYWFYKNAIKIINSLFFAYLYEECISMKRRGHKLLKIWW